MLMYRSWNYGLEVQHSQVTSGELMKELFDNITLIFQPTAKGGHPANHRIPITTVKLSPLVLSPATAKLALLYMAANSSPRNPLW